MQSTKDIGGYRELAELLAHEIESGRYKPGSRLPGEIEMNRRYNLNRHTVRAALKELVDRDYIYRVQGKGTYVSHRKVPYVISTRTRFSTTIQSLGLKSGARLISMKKEQADDNLARQLEIQSGDPVTVLIILRKIESVPVAYSRVCLSDRRFPDLDLTITEFHSLYHVLEQSYGVTGIKRASSVIETEFPNTADQKHLHLSAHTPVMVVSSLARDGHGNAVEFCVSRCRGDVYSLHVDLT